MKTLNTFFLSPRASTLASIDNKLSPASATKKSKTTPRKRPRKSIRSNERRLQQTILDAGQKKIGLEQCIKCGMVYNIDDLKEVEQHNTFHNRFTETKGFRVTSNQLQTWKKQLPHEYVAEPVEGTLFRIDANSTATLRRKFEDIVRDFVNEEVGYCTELPIWDAERRRQAIIFISAPDNGPPFAAGLIMVDLVEQAILMPQNKPFKGKFFGVERIWVHSKMRRKGIATFLLDSARRLMATGGVLPKSRVAFGDPTEAGVKLAINYIGDKENGRYICYTSIDEKTSFGQMRALQKKLGL